MGIDLQKIDDMASKFSHVQDVNSLSGDIKLLNNKLNEYKNIYRINSYAVPSVICEMNELNNNIKEKYNTSFKKFIPSAYSINMIGAPNDNYQRDLENSISVLSKEIVSKVCNYCGINVQENDLNLSESSLSRYCDLALDSLDTSVINQKIGFKISY